ncbi:hypothetical protein FA09DRAFT_327658 [Tilletiopsis washingtonensis]|uniref:Uncharacterized protein n=1 Tax=Tilletiopsis washingtonensis TaxID=58919 RepID=A0A316ZI54_9BASI|nr:hypothetical protein FA09DRAFT_327658 [Tilletiopsis washingtonensis]PWO00947.1 hypothetical protein FA09DRAFT_327658 [Tilletiopsis washingtonensis]
MYIEALGRAPSVPHEGWPLAARPTQPRRGASSHHRNRSSTGTIHAAASSPVKGEAAGTEAPAPPPWTPASLADVLYGQSRHRRAHGARRRRTLAWDRCF